MADVTIVSDTIQEFRGERFYLCGHYFQHKGKRLHRAVWESYNGEIPEGYHVHHIDEDRSNNEIENLALMPGIEHVRHHAGSEKCRERGRKVILLAIAAAPEWHASKEGGEWHSKHGKATWAKMPYRETTCEFCGKRYMTRDANPSHSKYCGQNCRMKARRRRMKAEKNED